MKSKVLNILVAAFAALVLVYGAASGAEYPTKPINFLIPFGAGGSADLMGRALASAAGKILGQPVVPINKPGAGGGIMYTALHQAAPDGYTLGWNSTSIVTCTNIGNVPFTCFEFDHVCRIGFTAMPIAVRADSPFKTLEELKEYGKKNPGKIKIGNAGTGSGTHLTAVLIEQALGIKAIHVPLGAERRIPSLLGGEVEAICVPLPEVAPQVEAGQARILVMTTQNRDAAFPDVPTMTELGYPVLMDLFRGVSAPRGTPPAVIQKLEAAFKQAAASPDFVKIAEQNGFVISFMGHAEFQEYMNVQNANVAKAMESGGLK